MFQEKNIIFEWNDFFKENGLNIEIFDIESLATFRGMFDDFPENFLWSLPLPYEIG